MAVLVIANARAGSAEREAVDEAAEALSATGTVTVTRTAEEGEIDGALDGLDARTLVLAGGDGTLRAVLQRLERRGELARTPIGLVPLGTGNDFARTVGLPLHPKAAAELLPTARPRELDLLVDDAGTVVVNVAHAGLGAEAADRSADLKDHLGAVAYPIGALLAAVGERGWDLRVAVDGQPPVDAASGPSGRNGRPTQTQPTPMQQMRPTPMPMQPTLMVAVGNGRTIGGGTPLCPGADPSDGLVDVVVVHAVGPAARAAFGRALLRGEHCGREDVSCLRGREVTIAGDTVRHNLDGEVGEPVGERTYRVLPAAWSLLLPVPGAVRMPSP